MWEAFARQGNTRNPIRLLSDLSERELVEVKLLEEAGLALGGGEVADSSVAV